MADLLPGRSTFICSIEPAEVPSASPRYAIQKEAAGEKLEFSLIIMHAEDQLISAETIKDLAIEIIEMHEDLSSK